MVDAMAVHSSELGFGFQHVPVSSKAKLLGLLDELAVHARDQNMKPLIHFDTHGNKDAGIYVDGEDTFVDWNTLAEKLQAINIHTQNNLAVVGATCFGFRAIKPISLQTAVPFFLLLAPEEKVNVGFLEDNVPNFYRGLFEFGSIDTAYSRHLSDKFKYFHCEKMLFMVIARYLKEQCKGKGGAARRERLITEILSQGMEDTPDNLKRVRKMLKDGLRPDQSLLDRYAGRFLIGRQCRFSMADLESFIDSDN
ncbi:hypothetical protein B0E51_02170 [Rhodanobacter sp. C05]|nr:hypothetical protein B0E51_02170 [Rhodanobacter sp. C05]